MVSLSECLDLVLYQPHYESNTHPRPIIEFPSDNVINLESHFTNKEETPCVYSIISQPTDFIIPARTENVIEIPTPGFSGEHFCSQLEISSGNSIGIIHNGKARINVLNSNEHSVIFSQEDIKLVLDPLDMYNVLHINFDKYPVEERIRKILEHIKLR